MNDTIHNALREPKRVQQLSRVFARSLSALDLAEPLSSLDENQPARMAEQLMGSRNLSVLGVRRNGLIAGWIGREDLSTSTIGEQAREFSESAVLDTSAGCEAILAHLAKAEHIFIEWLGEVAAIITRRDLQKPPMRMWLFGAITMLDSNLTWAIRQLYPAGTWQSHISQGRFEKASVLRAERERRGNACDLVDCLQITDKTDILMHDRENLAVLGMASRNEAERFTRGIEKLRNHLAHAQELEDSDLTLAARLASLIDAIVAAEGAQRLVALQGAITTSASRAPVP